MAIWTEPATMRDRSSQFVNLPLPGASVPPMCGVQAKDAAIVPVSCLSGSCRRFYRGRTTAYPR
jgi:hypothetical protein